MGKHAHKVVFLSSPSSFGRHDGARSRQTHLINLIAQAAETEVLFHSSEGIDSSALTPQVRLTRIDGPVGSSNGTGPGFSLSMGRALRSRAADHPILWASGPSMSVYFPLAHRLGYRTVLENPQLASPLETKFPSLSPQAWSDAWQSMRARHVDARCMRATDTLVVTSEIGSSRLLKEFPHRAVHVIPPVLRASLYESARGSNGRALFFSGSLNFQPNIEGLQWFIAEILPRLKAAMGNTMPPLLAAGAEPSSDTLNTLQAAGFEVVANPASMVPLLREAAVVIVPIRSNAGSRMKILEGMAAGKPVVSTGKGAEGLVLTPTYDVFIAEDADRFTSVLARLLRDSELREEIGANAVETVLNNYDVTCPRPVVREILESVGR